MAVRVGGQSAVLGVPSFLNRYLLVFPLLFSPWVTGIGIAGARRLLGSILHLCSSQERWSLLEWKPVVSALGSLGLAGGMTWELWGKLERRGKRKSKNYSLPILLPHHGHHLKSILHIYFKCNIMYMQNWSKTNSMMNTSILTTIFISIGFKWEIDSLFQYVHIFLEVVVYVGKREQLCFL